MGAFYVNCRVETHDRKHHADVPGMLVDTGSEYTWVDGNVLERIGITRQKKDLTFVTANGQHVTRSVGYAIVHAAETETTDEVVFAEPGDQQLLGSRTLE